MKTVLGRLYVLASLAILIGANSLTAATKYNFTIKGIVSKLSDGDTIWVKPDAGYDFRKLFPDNSQKELTAKQNRLKIRMVGIDTPEAHFPSKLNGEVAQKPWGDLATKAIEKMIPLNTRVEVFVTGEDKYWRTLARIFKKANEEDAESNEESTAEASSQFTHDVNLGLIASGWAVPYIICERTACDAQFLKRERVAEYLAACEDSRSKQLGVFDKKNEMKEMPFEFRMRNDGRAPDKWVGDFETLTYVQPDKYKSIDLCKRIFFMKEEEAKQAGFTRQ